MITAIRGWVARSGPEKQRLGLKVRMGRKWRQGRPGGRMNRMWG